MKPQLPLPSTDAQASSAHLTKLIKNEIEQHQNWISFSRFMELALYTPQYGYYSGGSHKIGTDGDFITAPPSPPIGQPCQTTCRITATNSRQYLRIWCRYRSSRCHTLAKPFRLPESLLHYRAIGRACRETTPNIFLSILPPETAAKVIHLTHYLNTLTASSSATKYWMPCRLNA